jgi:FkbM family methyltransferase
MRDVNGPAEVFGAGEYSIESIDWSQASYILDAGAHVGGFALWASVRAAPAARIVCFEPNPDVRQLLEINVAAAELGGRITVQPYALAASRGKRRLGRGDDSSASAFAQATSAADPQVETIGLEEALSLTGFPRVDVMKVDIEGAEYETFAAIAPDSLAHVGACIIECHPLPDARTESIAGLLRSCGYAVTERSKPLGLELLVGIRTRVPSTV